MKFLCKLGLHTKMSEWKQHPLYGNKETRNCIHCHWVEDRNKGKDIKK